jgi:hypothetical protein
MFFLILLAISIALQGYSTYTYAKVQEAQTSGYFCYIAWPLGHEPEKYWNFTDPDPYILEAIEHPGNWTEPFIYVDSTFWFTAQWWDPDTWQGVSPNVWWAEVVPFKYNETYYNYGVCIAGVRLSVNLLKEKPKEYWNLTDPDKYTLEAIENPGEEIVVAMDAKLNLQDGPFQHDGNYYSYLIACVDYGYPLPKPEIGPPKPEHTAIGLAGIWAIVGSVYILKNRKTKAKP